MITRAIRVVAIGYGIDKDESRTFCRTRRCLYAGQIRYYRYRSL